MHTLEKLSGLPHRPDEERLWLNRAMHWGKGVSLGLVRTLMAERSLVGSFLFLNLRFLNDQTLENATGVGAPPWTWPTFDDGVGEVFRTPPRAFLLRASLNNSL